MSNLKVEGKATDFCPKCKNCKSVTRACDWEKDWEVTEVECIDPYDGMKMTLAADSDICCSMFEPVTSKDKYSEPEALELIKDYEQILDDILDMVYEHPEMFVRNMTAYELLPRRVKLLKNSWDMMCDKYDPLNIENEQRKKAMDNQAKMIQDLKKERDELILNYHKKFKEKDNKINLLSDYYRTDEKLIDNIQKVIFPQEEGSDYTYSYDEILNKVKDLKVQSGENGTMYADLKYWKERCHNAETDVTTLNSKVEVLDKRNTNQFVMIGEKDKKIENLKKAVERRDRWVEEFKSDVDTLQNEILRIRNIAQKAYDDTNRD